MTFSLSANLWQEYCFLVCGVSQIELAERLSIQQGAVSRLERRSDIKISTIRDFVKSLGGDLKLMATFPDGAVKIVDLEDEHEVGA